MKKVKLSQVDQGELIKFSNRSDVYKVISNGYRTELLNMYNNKIYTFKPYTMKRGKMHYRYVQIVKFY